MRYLMGLAAGCALALAVTASTALAGAWEDCTKIDQNPDLAIRACSEVIREGNTTVTMIYAHDNRGVAYERNGDYKAAIADFSERIRLDPRDPYAYSRRGNAYLRSGEYGHAIIDFGEAIKRMPKKSRGYVERGRAYLAKGEHDHAIADLGHAIRVDPSDHHAYNNRGA